MLAQDTALKKRLQPNFSEEWLEMLRQKYELRSLHSENSSHKRDD
jgi:hypothetical protein